MDNQLPNDFDLIIVGTGVVESVISAAASRVGKRVLHIDSDDYYGGLWASFNLDTIEKLSQNCCRSISQENDPELLNEGEELLSIGNNLFNIEKFTYKWHVPKKIDLSDNNSKDKEKDEEKPLSSVEDETGEPANILVEDDWTQESISKDSRKFNIDLAPKLQYARGDFVELLISSNIARYSEYRSVSRVLTCLDERLEVVPCSRSDVFANSRVSVIEKRMLMKLLTSLDDGSEELKNYENKTFRAFLKEKRLTPSLIHYVLYAISMSTDETPCRQGVENTKRFLNSLGRFGKTPFLFSMYGSGEITQAFCRLSAVFGGVFALGQPLNGVVLADNRFKALLVGNQRIEAEHIVMSVEKSPEKFAPSFTKKYISRAVFITDRSIMDSDKEHLTLLLYPPEKNKNPITVIELGCLTGTCAKNVYLVHLISSQINGPQEDLRHAVENLFDTDFEIDKMRVPGRPQVIWSSYFSLPDSNMSDLKTNVPQNVYLCPGPDMDLDYDLAIKKAKEIFLEIYPGTEFLPRAPDPEEIIIGGDEDNNQEELRTNNDEDKTTVEELVHDIEKQSGDEDNNQEELRTNNDEDKKVVEELVHDIEKQSIKEEDSENI